MTSPWKKAIRDPWQERTRTVLVVLAIALGIAGFTAVLASHAILKFSLNEGYLATNPASAILRADRVDDSLLQAVLSNKEVSDAEARRSLRGRIKTGPAQWRELTLFVVDDFAKIRVSTLVREKGAWPPGEGEILVERDALRVARAKIGDAVTVKTQNGQPRALRVTGSVHDVGQAQARMENSVYGYITLATLRILGEEPFLNQLLISVKDGRFDKRHIEQVAQSVRALVESKGRRVERVDVPEPGKHPHADIMGLLLLALSAFGLAVTLLSGILVVNLMTALMASQVRQIGMMKAVGGTRWQIARIYLGQALLLGAAAIVLALPAGIIGSRALCNAMAVFLNFDIISYAIPAYVFLLVAAAGVFIPLLSAAYPVWRGSGVSVREALSDHGVSGVYHGSGAFDRLLAGVGGSARPLLLALRNGFRRRARLAMTLFTLAAGGLFFLTALNLRSSMINTLDRLFAARKYDLSLNLGTMSESEAIERAVRKTPGIKFAEGVIATEGTLPSSTAPKPSAAGLHGGGASLGGDTFTLFALPVPTQSQELNIVEGRGLRKEDGNALVVNNALAAKSAQFKVGNTVSLRVGPGELSFQVVGIAREPFSPAVGYLPLSYFESFHAGMVNNLRLALDQADAASIAAVREALDKNLEAEGIRAQGSLTKADSRFGFDQHMVMIYVALIIMSCVIGGVGALGLSTTMSLNVLERRREMGVLRAIGARPRMIWLIIVTEGALTGLMSWAIAALAAFPVSRALGNALVSVAFKSGLDFTFELRGLFIWLAASLLLGAASSFLPAWHASRCPVREALAYE